MNQEDEQAIISRILSGDEQLYALLIDRYKEGLYHHCFKFVRGEDWAEDITQETFIRAYCRLEKYNQAYRFSTWLYKIATNHALEEIRKNRPLVLENEDYIESNLPNTDQLAKNREVHEAISLLPDRYRKVITKRYWEGKSYKQIAVEMATSTGNIKGWMNRAKKHLKELLS